MKYYKLKVPRMKTYDVPAGKPVKLESREQLSRQVMGKRASDYEERAYISFRKNPGITYIEFRVPYIMGVNMPGAVELDYLVRANGLFYPIQIDGGFAHKTAEQKEEDKLKDAILNNRLMRRGVQLVMRVPGTELETQDASDRYFGEKLR